MRYRDPDTGRWITEAHWYEIEASKDEPPEPDFDYGDDDYDWGHDLDPDEYEG